MLFRCGRIPRVIMRLHGGGSDSRYDITDAAVGREAAITQARPIEFEGVAQ